jgi:hypothetical protein
MAAAEESTDFAHLKTTTGIPSTSSSRGRSGFFDRDLIVRVIGNGNRGWLFAIFF